MSGLISPAQILTPEIVAQLTPAERLVLAYRASVWARPEQIVPPGDWRWIFFRAGRGWGKTTFCIAPEINRLVRSGACTKIALVAPNEDRADDVQIQSLIDAAPPWFRPERFDGGIRWPNGVRGLVFSPGANAPRGSTFSHGWATEIVDWAPSTRLKTWEQLSLTVRKPGSEAKIFIDSTSSGKNDLYSKLMKEHADFPARHLVRFGTTFDNPTLPRKYLQTVCNQYAKGSRRFLEEVMGESFEENAGALWKHVHLDSNRRAIMPTSPALRVVALDPTMSARPEADEAGIHMASADDAGHYYAELDLSGRITMAEQAQRCVDACLQHNASGVVIERNHAGDGPHDLIVLVAAQRGAKVERLAADRPMPSHRPGTIYVREYNAARSKASRAEPVARLYEEGRVHHVGHFDALELEMTTWEADSRDSPNRLDACVYAIAELAALGRPASTALADVQSAINAAPLLRPRLIAMGARRGL